MLKEIEKVLSTRRNLLDCELANEFKPIAIVAALLLKVQICSVLKKIKTTPISTSTLERQLNDTTHDSRQ